MRLSPEAGHARRERRFPPEAGPQGRGPEAAVPAFPRCCPGVAVQSSTDRASLSRRATDFRLRAARDAGGGIFGAGRWRSRPSAATLRNHRAPGRKRQGCCRRFFRRSGHRHVNGTRGCRRYRDGPAGRAALGTPCGVKGGRDGSAEPWACRGRAEQAERGVARKRACRPCRKSIRGRAGGGGVRAARKARPDGK